MTANWMTLARASAPNARYSQAERMKDGVYDCSSFIGRHLNSAGINIRPNITTADMNPAIKNGVMSKAGFVWHEGMDGVQEGDVLWRDGHTEFSAGQGRTLGAHSTKSGVSEYASNQKYKGYWRYAGEDTPVNPPTNRPSDVPVVPVTPQEQGFANPMVAQSVGVEANRRIPDRQVIPEQGFRNFQVDPRIMHDLLAMVQGNNATLANLAADMGRRGFAVNSAYGV